MGYVATRLSAKDRALNLFEAWRVADDDADIEMRIGQSSDKEPAIFISIGPNDMHAFLASEADVLVRILKNTLTNFPAPAMDAGLDNLLLGIEQAIEAAKSRPTSPNKGEDE